MSMTGLSGTSKFCAIVMIVSVLLSIVQLSLGCDPAVVGFSMAAIVVGLIPVMVYGAAHFMGVMFIFVTIYFGFAALVVKSILLQPLEMYLYAPVQSHLIAAIGVLGASVGALTAKPFLRKTKGWIPTITDFQGLRTISFVAFVIAAAGMVLSRLGGGAHALANFMTPYIYLALAAEMARSLLLTNGARVFSMPAVVMTLLVVLQTVSTNSKSGFLVIGVTYLAAMSAFGGKFRWGSIVAAVMGLAFLSSFVFPAVTYVARGDRDRLSPIALVGRTVEATFDLMAGDEETRKIVEDISLRGSRLEYGRYNIPYSRHIPSITERIILVQFIDAVVWRIPMEGPFHGMGFILDKVPDNLPNFLNKNKQTLYTGHEIVWSLGLYENGKKSYPTITLPTESFYAGGLSSVFLFSCVIYFVYSIVFGKVFGNITWSVFGVYAIARYDHFIMGGVTNNATFLLFRQLPFDLLFFLLLTWLARQSSERPRRARLEIAAPRPASPTTPHGGVSSTAD